MGTTYPTKASCIHTTAFSQFSACFALAAQQAVQPNSCTGSPHRTTSASPSRRQSRSDRSCLRHGAGWNSFAGVFKVSRRPASLLLGHMDIGHRFTKHKQHPLQSSPAPTAGPETTSPSVLSPPPRQSRPLPPPPRPSHPKPQLSSPGIVVDLIDLQSQPTDLHHRAVLQEFDPLPPHGSSGNHKP